MNFKRILKNIFWAIISYAVTLVLGFLIPKLMIGNYGSEVNGLFATITQIYVYLALLEAGVGAASMQVLYGPVARENKDEINSILSASSFYFRKCAKSYFIGVVVLSLTLPFILKTSIEHSTVIIIVLLQGLVSVINFYFLSTLKLLLGAEGKNYIISNITNVINIISGITKIVLVNLTVHIIFLQLSYFIIHIVSMLIYLTYFRKNYKWINLNVEANFDALKQRSYFLIHQVSGLIFGSTDILAISIFAGVKYASIYAIYDMIVFSASKLINIITGSATFALGQKFNQNRERYVIMHDAFKTFYSALSFALLSICYLLLIPFIKIYIKDPDINYIYPYLPLLFCLVSVLSASRSIEAQLISFAQHAKQTLPQTIIESSINLSLSLILVNIYGMHGVLIATIVAMLYRANDMIIYANKKILNRSPIRSYKTVLINFMLFGIVVLINNYVEFSIGSYIEFFKVGVLIGVPIVAIYFMMNFLVDYESSKFIYNFLRSKYKRL